MAVATSGFRRILSRFFLGACFCGAAATTHGDAIRVDKEWLQDVYVIETAQFYRVLNPKDGTVKEISKKRQDISAPQWTKDTAARTRLKEQWEKAAKDRAALDAREAELRADLERAHARRWCRRS